MRPDCTAALRALLDRRILVLDGAMGTMIQNHKLTEAGYRGDALPRLARGSQGQQRSARPHAARADRRDPSRVPRGRRGSHRDQHVQLQPAVDGGLRHGGAGLRAELHRGAHRARRRGRMDRADAGPAALRRGRARTDQQDRIDLARRQRSGLPQHHVRRAGGGVHRSAARPVRRRRRSDPGRDDLRHAQREGRDLRDPSVLRRGRCAPAGHVSGTITDAVGSHAHRPDH